MAVDGAGNVYVADQGNQRIRKIAGGIVSTLAGTGAQGSADGPAGTATFCLPSGVAVDSAGSVFAVDMGNHRIRKISPPTTTVLARSSLTGVSAVPVDLPLTNLLPGTTYYFRALATNATGSASGEILGFATKSLTTLALISSLNPSVFGDSVIFTATVTPTNATGTVTFKAGATTLGTGTLTGGVATLTNNTLTAGNQSLTAEYAGATTYAAATNAPALAQTVHLAFSGPGPALSATVGSLFAPGIISAAGGTPGITYAITAGSLPAGIGLYPYLDSYCYFHGTTYNPAGDYSVTLDATDANGATGSQTYTISLHEPPAVTSLSPTNGLFSGGTVVTLTGTGFTGATNVSFGASNVPAAGFTVVSPTQIIVTSPSHLAGWVDVTVTTPWGTSATHANAHYLYLLPNATLATGPGDAAFSTQGTVLLAEYYGESYGVLPVGSLLFSHNAARLGADARPYVGPNPPWFGATADGTNLSLICNNDVYSTSALTTVLPTAAGANYVLKLLFHDNYFSAPVSRAFTVKTGLESAGTSPLVQNFDMAALGAYGTNPALVVVTVPVAPADGTPFAVQLVPEVNNPLLCALVWEEVSPVIAALAPTNGPHSGGTPVVITGRNFTGATNVAFGAVNVPAGSFTVNSATQITVTNPPHLAGLVDVTVTTPWGTSVTNAGARFTYCVDPPAYPQLTITSPASNTVVPFAVTNCAFAETSGGTATGALAWSNALTLAAGTLPVASSWNLPNLALGVGANVITVTATNLAGMATVASSTVTRRPYAWDSVGDGVPDAWRAQYFGGDGTTTNASSSAASDSDRDGMSNLQEYTADTNPTNAASIFRISAPMEVAGGVSVPFASSANRLYSLEVSSSLRGDWSAVPGQVDIPGTGGELSLRGPSAPGAHFYRVRVRLP